MPYDTESAQQMIRDLQTFSQELAEKAAKLGTLADECAQNNDNDQHVQKLAGQVKEHAAAFKQAAAEASELASEMQEELNDVLEAGNDI